LLATRSFNIAEMCRWFRVPPFMVGHNDGTTPWGTGMEQQMIGFITFVLRPWCVRIEQGIRKSLLTPVERQRYFAEFSMEGLLRADSAARAAFYSSMTQNGIYTRDDCRRLENLPVRGGNADELTVQSNLLPIEKLGQALPTASPPADGANT
jgi:HK97 family phage portal protein